MDEWFDGLAKDSARTLSRRQVIGRVAAGMGAAVLAVLGMQAKGNENCGRLCVECCKNNFPRGGPEFAECVRQCHDGEGICGPIVCPQE